LLPSTEQASSSGAVLEYLIKRIAVTFITLFLVSVFCFIAFSVIRGDPASLRAGINASEEQLELLRKDMGLDRSIPERYLDWLSCFVTGNTGYSLRFPGEPISGLIGSRFPVSVSLALLSLLFILIISVPLSVFTVKREGGAIDRAVNALTGLGVSIPGFFLGLLFIWVFGLGFRLFSPGRFVGWNENFAGFLGCLVFPALAIAVPNSAMLVKFLRGSLFKELKTDYVRTALGKGMVRSMALRRHVFKNALVPSITVFGMIIAEVFSGSIVIEQVFTIPGIGRLLIAAISSRDYPLIQSLVVYIAFVVVLANTLADIAIQLVDPRIRLEKQKL
jgi:ABC-type dipeptide/oligopeptide/nickel transport system permease component